MVLIDTSLWIDALRRDGDDDARERVKDLILAGEAGICAYIELELWNGVRGEAEKRKLEEIIKAVEPVDIDAETWETARVTARSARSGGLTVPASDILIFACARRHGAGLEHRDNHLTLLAKPMSDGDSP